MNPLDVSLSLTLVDKKLKSLAPKGIDGVGRLLQASGKRLRPSLVLSVALCGSKKVDDNAITAAVAVELVHLASLVHDDIIDNGTLRHGVPTINAKEGTDAAILAGDYLFATGCALAASISAKAGMVMAETIMELCQGQAQEFRDQHDTERTVVSLNVAIKGKTSSLFMAACKLGGLASSTSPKDLKILSEFAENYGIAFQYLDDVKDFTEASETSGKSAGSDIGAGNYTLPVILSLQKAHAADLKELLKMPHVSTERVLEILNKDKSIETTLTEASRYKQLAYENLGELSEKKLRDTLTYFVDSL